MNHETQVEPDTHSSDSSPTIDGTISLPHDDLDIPIAHRKEPRITAGRLSSKLSSYDISNHVSYISIGPQYKSFVGALQSVSVPHDW